MPTPPIFQRVEQTHLYELQRSPKAMPGPVVAFLSAAAESSPASLTLVQAWSEVEGIFLFLDSAPTDADKFVDAVRFLVSRSAFRFCRLLWISQVDRQPAPGIVGRLRAQPVAPGGTSWRILETATLSFANYSLRLGAGCVLALDSTQSALQLTPSTSPSPNIVFAGPEIELPISSDSALLPFTEPQPGVVQCRFTLSLTDSAAKPSAFERLDVGCAFFAPAATGDGSVEELFFPVLLQPSGQLELHASFDPLLPYDGNRTALGLLDPQVSAAGPVFETTFVTARGYGWTLTAQASTTASTPSAQLVFARRPIWTEPTQPALHYLTFEGPFLLTPASTQPPVVSASPGERVSKSGLPAPVERFLCGIAGAEYLGLTADSGNVLHFVPGGSSFAPRFGEGKGVVATANGAAPLALTPVGTTAYTYLTPASATQPIYVYAQPQSSLLYEVSSAGSGVLDFLEVPSGRLPATQTEGFPMVPYTRVDASRLDLFTSFETLVISPARRSIWRQLTEGQSKIPSTSGTAGVTPRGLQVELSDNALIWQTLTLASTSSGPLQLQQVQGQLRSVMLSNRLFLVAANGDEFQKSCTVPPGFELEIADWRFQIAPDQWYDAQRASNQNAILIFKFCPGTLAELVLDLASWPWPQVAQTQGGTAAQTQLALIELFTAAKTDVSEARAKGQTSPFTHLVEKVIDNEHWNGMVVFNVAVPLDQLPAQLESLSTGIDPALFYAHHVGFSITPIGIDNGEVTSGDSALFGLINYQDAQDLVFQNGVTYDFKVLSLQVLFENSQIASFASRIELMVNELFGAPASLIDTQHGNNILLRGVYQQHTDIQGGGAGGSQGSYQFSQVGPSVFRLESSALLTVEVLTAQFVTLPKDPQQPDLVRSQFVLGGELCFLEPPFFDLFSFGPHKQPAASSSSTESQDIMHTEYGPHAAVVPARDRWRVLLEPGVDRATQAVNGYLDYNNLVVSMQFSTSQASQRSFAFIPIGVSFDVSQSVARPESLFAKFPLELQGLVASPPVLDSTVASSDQTPMDLGYVSVSAPLQQGKLTSPWFGLVYEVDLGTLGSLAGGSAIRLSVLAAWSQGDQQDQAALFLGVKFPGSNGLGAELGVEGVLKLGFQSIDFLVSQTTQGRAYMLRMRQFALSLLGKAFPPGNNDVYLFGDPTSGANTTLGWYACYSDGSNDDKNQDSAVRQVLAGRRGRRGAG